jgi:hypothetical protein
MPGEAPRAVNMRSDATLTRLFDQLFGDPFALTIAAVEQRWR